MVRELYIRSQDGGARTLALDGEICSLGRLAVNDLCYPDDHILSRQHMVFERDGDDWSVRDLGSKNGTQVNGQVLEGKRRLRPGDRVVAGRLTIVYDDPFRGSANTLEFVEVDEDATHSTASVSTNLDRVISSGDGLEVALGPSCGEGLPRMRALMEAGRELAGHRPLGELFGIILDLAVRSVGARRGVLLTIERDELVVRAARGEGFRISAAVRDRVLRQKTSLLVADASQDASLRGSSTIAEYRVRSLMAAPLETGDNVIGLIYVDSHDVVRAFSAEDLNLLTVMANVAATRIEHARLVELEHAERLMARELEQAAEIQRSLLPEKPPSVKGVELAARSVPCRAVGGDYYEFFPFPDGRLLMVIADVAGKGLPASLLMASLQARVQVLVEETADLSAIVGRLNRAVCAHCPPNRFISLFMAAFDPGARQLRWLNAGHNSPLVVRSSGEVLRLEAGSPVLGIAEETSHQEQRLVLSAGDVLVLYSDGVTEARNRADDEFGEQRLVDEVRKRQGQPARVILEAVESAITAFLEEIPPVDDVTLVVARPT